MKPAGIQLKLYRATRNRPSEQAEQQQADEMTVVDVVGMLEQKAAANPQELNWKVSIVDLLKLLDMDSSYEARKELAVELNGPTEFMDDSAQMDTWLHKTVLQKISGNGGNVPKELLD
jgi:hypothetical protein